MDNKIKVAAVSPVMNIFFVIVILIRSRHSLTANDRVLLQAGNSLLCPTPTADE